METGGKIMASTAKENITHRCLYCDNSQKFGVEPEAKDGVHHNLVKTTGQNGVMCQKDTRNIGWVYKGVSEGGAKVHGPQRIPVH